MFARTGHFIIERKVVALLAVVVLVAVVVASWLHHLPRTVQDRETIAIAEWLLNNSEPHSGTAYGYAWWTFSRARISYGAGSRRTVRGDLVLRMIEHPITPGRSEIGRADHFQIDLEQRHGEWVIRRTDRYESFWQRLSEPLSSFLP